MTVDLIENAALLSKSLSLVEKTIANLEQVDTETFPSKASNIARQIVLDSLATLRKPEYFRPICPHSLFRNLLKIQSLVQDIESSHIEKVSWPIVSYCDEIWSSVFGTDGPVIFYSTTNTHNYSIFPFSERLIAYLHDLLPKAEINRVVQKRIYCLHLPSLEHDNLPLHANIVHEFGHAIYQHDVNILPLWHKCFEKVLRAVVDDLSASPTAKSKQKKTRSVLICFGKELFADLFAAYTFGLSFFLSLYEMSWGDQRSFWSVVLSPRDFEISAHPSGNHRLHVLRSRLDLNDFVRESQPALIKLQKPSLRKVAELFERIPIGNTECSVNVLPASDNDSADIRKVLSQRLPEIKEACEEFGTNCWAFLSGKYSHSRDTTMPNAIYELLSRLENGILPNIIPDGSLLGVPASFQAILLSSALYRMALLLPDGAEVKPQEIRKELRKLEHLTTKAFEATFIQKEFSKWRDAGD